MPWLLGLLLHCLSQASLASEQQLLAYDNPVAGRDAQTELGALRSALAIAKLLNRSVILPRFHCGAVACDLGAIVSMAALEEEFSGLFRTSAPGLSEGLLRTSEDGLRTSEDEPRTSEDELGPLVITSQLAMDLDPSLLFREDVLTFEPKEDDGMNEEEIRLHFGFVSQTLLRFHSLYDAFSRFTDAEEDRKWKEKFHRGLKRR